MRKTTLGIVLPLLLLAACSASSISDDDDTMTDDTMMMDDSSSSVSSGPFLDDDAMTDDSDSSEAVELTVSSSSEAATSAPSEEPAAGETRVIAMTVTDWEFSPSSIIVKQGEKVQIALTGEKGIHGFAIPELGINVRVEAGKTITVDIPTERTGTFNIRCSVPCGAGHSAMKGSIVVQ